MARQLQFILLGLLAGASFWVISELPWDWRDNRAYASLAVLALVFFTAALGMLGELGARRSVLLAALVALPASALVALKSLGFVTVEQMLSSGHVALALLAVSTIPVPFLLALAKGGGRGWKDYPALYSESWNLVVRYAAACLFVAVVWLVLWLLSSLLALVGIAQVGTFLSRAPVVWLVSGAVLGLGLSVVTELSDMVSPYLVLRLLRLLAPLVLLVEVVFVAVLPLSGLARPFGYMSPAAILIATALASVLLVAVAVDQDDAEAATSPLVSWSARGLCLLLPVLAGLGFWALALRVEGHGWSPARVATAAALLLIAGYALGYGLAVLRGAGWAARVRRVNIVMALATVLVAALWLTPLLSAEALAARSQLARFTAGESRADGLPLWELGHEWGRPGLAALEELRRRADLPGQEELARRIAQLDAAKSRADVDTPALPALAERVAALRSAIHVLPEGEPLPEPLLLAIARMADQDWAAGCAQRSRGNNPGCLLVIGDFAPLQPGRDALFVRLSGLESVLAFHERGANWTGARPAFIGAGGVPSGSALIDALMAAGGALAPADLRAIPLGAQQITVIP